ncbi:hypothetical protein VUR80DRAFT_2296 [Thermomyces stellatus]
MEWDPTLCECKHRILIRPSTYSSASARCIHLLTGSQRAAEVVVRNNPVLPTPPQTIAQSHADIACPSGLWPLFGKTSREKLQSSPRSSLIAWWSCSCDSRGSKGPKLYGGGLAITYSSRPVPQRAPFLCIKIPQNHRTGQSRPLRAPAPTVSQVTQHIGRNCAGPDRSRAAVIAD